MKKCFFFLFIILSSQFFLACNSVDTKQFITESLHDQLSEKCRKKSLEPVRCEWAHYEKNILEYCEKNKISENSCDQVKLDVMKVFTKYLDKENKAAREMKEAFDRDMYTR